VWSGDWNSIEVTIYAITALDAGISKKVIEARLGCGVWAIEAKFNQGERVLWDWVLEGIEDRLAASQTPAGSSEEAAHQHAKDLHDRDRLNILEADQERREKHPEAYGGARVSVELARLREWSSSMAAAQRAKELPAPEEHTGTTAMSLYSAALARAEGVPLTITTPEGRKALMEISASLPRVRETRPPEKESALIPIDPSDEKFVADAPTQDLKKSLFSHPDPKPTFKPPTKAQMATWTGGNDIDGPEDD
jgi:hypothetical protein